MIDLQKINYQNTIWSPEIREIYNFILKINSNMTNYQNENMLEYFLATREPSKLTILN